MKSIVSITCAISVLLLPAISWSSDDNDAPQPGDLPEIQRVEEPALKGVTGVAVSPDGRFIYAAAFHTNTVTTFQRDASTGKLTLLDEITDPLLKAAVAVRLSKDGGYVVVPAFGANAITVFRRDKDSGKLTRLCSAQQGEGDNDGLDFAIDANFSADNHFIYTGASDGVGVYRFENEKLTFVQLHSADGKLSGVRGTTFSPNGEYFYAPCYQSKTVGVFKPNPQDGKLELLQLLEDEKDGCEGLAGAFRVGCSPDGKTVYVSSGRFGGDQAITVFASQPDGKLQLVEQHMQPSPEMDGFQGGNDIKVSPDGRLTFALASVSDRLFRFQRDQDTGALISIGSQQVGAKASPGAAGLCFSPDSKFVYIADENSGAIVVLSVP